MEKTDLTQRTIIGNVNTLDIRRATESSVANIERIGNVNILLHSRETAHLIPLLGMGNVNVVVEAPENAQSTTGQVVISRDFGAGREIPGFMVVTGQVLVKPDVTAEDLEKGIAGLVVVGQILCPEPLLGIMQSKTVQLVGQSIGYPPSGRVIIGSLEMDEAFLRSLDDGTALVVVGSLRLPNVVPNELLASKLASVYAVGGVRVHEENAETLQGRLTNGKRKVTVIPAGFTLVTKPLVLDDAMLETLPAAKLFCLDRVVVSAGTSPELLEERLERMVVKDVLICPSELKGLMARRCNLLETQALFYDGELWLVGGAEHLSASRFEYLSGQATLVVTGALKVDPEIEPKVLAERLAKVHNLGAIHCSQAQEGALRARMGVNEGVLGTDAGEEEGEPEHGVRRLGNMNHLVL
jgi:hypothetical protein